MPANRVNSTESSDMNDHFDNLNAPPVFGQSPELSEQELAERRQALLALAKAAGVAGLATTALLTSRRVRAASAEG